MRIDGAIALVTGANRGLGQAYVEALLEAGAAKVYAAARDPATITDPRVTPVRLDITAPDQVAAAARQCPDITLLINNAGLLRNSPLLAEDAQAAMRAEMEVNVHGPHAMIIAFAPILAANGGGAIVNVLSVGAWFVVPVNATYCATKHAALAVSDAARIQLKAQGTRVVGVYAGYIDTDMAADVHGPKTSPAHVAQRTLDGLREGRDHVYADTVAEDAWRTLRTEPERIAARMQQVWDRRTR